MGFLSDIAGGTELTLRVVSNLVLFPQAVAKTSGCPYVERSESWLTMGMIEKDYNNQTVPAQYWNGAFGETADSQTFRYNHLGLYELEYGLAGSTLPQEWVVVTGEQCTRNGMLLMTDNVPSWPA